MGKAVDASLNFATGGMVGYKDGKIGTGVVGGAVDKATDGGLSKGFKGITDTLLGKKDPGTPDEVIDLADPYGRELQSKALGQFGSFLNKDMGQVAANQVNQQEKQARAIADDNERLAKQMVTQRGIGNSSVGINAILNSKAGLGKQLNTIRASLPGLENQLSQQNIQFATGGINSILGEQGQSKIFKQGQASKGRQGGILPLLGGAAGAYFGGPAGAQVGMGLGQTATQVG